jgi:hypothetical protein
VFEKRRAQKARQQFDAALAAWQAEHDELAAVLEAARTKSGLPAESLVLKPNEAVFARVAQVGLIEMRRGAGHYAGASQGVSIPIGSIGGRSVRYRVGASRGHYVQGTPHPEAVDIGELTMTNQRIVFLGRAKTIECAFTKLVAIQQSPGEISVSVSNRQAPTVVFFGPQLDGWMKLRLDLCLSLFRGDEAAFEASVEESLRQLEAEMPRPPQPVSGR